ncbi:glycine-N-acyltransferase-like protein 3 [Liasis olivaceus]
MQILICLSKLQLLQGVLRRSLPQALSVHGAVIHINRGNSAQHEVMVDFWPKFKVVLTCPHKEVVKDKWDSYSNLNAAFYWDRDACQAQLEKEEVIDWGIQDGLYEITRGLAEAKNVHLEPYDYQPAIHPDPSTIHPMGSLKHYSHGFPLYLGVLADNQSSKNALKRQGFPLLPGTYYMLFVMPTFKN